MKRLVLLSSLALLLSACGAGGNASSTPESSHISSHGFSHFSSTSSSETYTQENKESSDISSNFEQSSEIGSSSSISSNSSQQNRDAYYLPSNQKYALDSSSWTTFEFFDEYGPKWATDWNYFYNSTHNPISSGFYGGEEADKGNGAALEKKGQYLVSPLFNSWEKVEANFEVWFCSHTSDKYKSTSGEPQLLLRLYDDKGMQVGTENVFLERSDKPSNGYYKLNVDLYNSKMSFFELAFNNSVANGSSGYTFAIHSVAMKGWPYGQK